MINPTLHLHKKLFNTGTLEQHATRDGFGRGLVEAGKRDNNVVALCADLMESTRAHLFQKEFPERYIELGVAEQNLAAVASGLANYGKKPFIMSYATFSPGRNWEQIRSTICINEVPVKIIGSHAGISVGPDGATHQALEDIAITRVLPEMTVIVPADDEQAYKATLAIATTDKPSYLRLARAKTPVFTTPETPFEIGKVQVMYTKEQARIGIIACGSLVYPSLCAANALEKEGLDVSVLNLHTIKPIDVEGILEFTKDLDLVITAEEHQKSGGMGSAVAEVLSQHQPRKMVFIGIPDRFGESAEPQELMDFFGFTQEGIVDVIKQHTKKSD
jgi:transketolase